MRALRQSQWFLGLLCLLLIAARMSGAHWHLCFDQIEPPLTLHVGDFATHDGNNTSSHQDMDLQLVEDGLIKTLSAGQDLPLALALFALLWLLPLRKQSMPPPGYRILFFSSRLRPLHAPPRAPPL